MPATASFTAEARTKAIIRASDPFLFKRARTWWMLLALFLMADGGGLFTTQGLHPGLGNVGPGAAAADQSTLSLQLLFGGMWVIFAALMIGHLVPTLELLLKQKAALAFVFLAIASTAWSQAPVLTFRKALLLFLYLLFAWFFASYYSSADQLRLLLFLGFVMAVGSLLWGVLLPKYGLHQTGEWKGIFGQKNFLGSTMVILFSGLPFVPIRSTRRLLTIALQGLLPLGLILLSRSRSSLIMAFILVAVRVLGPLLTRTRREMLPFMFFCVSLGLAFIPISAGIILPLLGRDLTFTGRSHIWAMLFPLALKHLWLGYGYQAFFTTASGEGGPVLLGTGTGALFSVDNGYLDILLQCGLAGVGLMFALLIGSMRDLLIILRRPPVPLFTFWYAGLVITIFIGSIAENMLWKPIRIVPFMLAVASAGLGDLRYQITASPLSLISAQDKR